MELADIVITIVGFAIGLSLGWLTMLIMEKLR